MPRCRRGHLDAVWVMLTIGLLGLPACRPGAPASQPVPTLTAMATRAGTSTEAGRNGTATGEAQAKTATASPSAAAETTATLSSSPTISSSATPTASHTATPVRPTPTGAATATSKPTEAPAPAVTVRETTLSIPTYPYAGYLTQAFSAEFGMPFLRLDWAAYEAANPKPAERSYRAIVLENELLALTLLPELGGRIYRCVFKPAGHNILYNNPVIKPTRWGPKEQGWWLAAGGIEYGLPVEEHGYESGVPWQVELRRSPEAISVRLISQGEHEVRPYGAEKGRLRASIDVTLRAGEARFTLSPLLENGTDHTVKLKYWTNAMLAPGGKNRVSDNLQLVFPADQVTVHSSGDASLPDAGQPMSWPIWQGRDLSYPANWRGWLGFFERPRAGGPFAGVYDHAADEGLVRVFPPDVAAGAKGFGFGAPAYALPATLWTDDGSTYVELHGGLAPTFDDAYELPAGGQVAWQETWYPVAGLGGLTAAGPSGAAHAAWDASQRMLTLRLMPTRRIKAQIDVLVNSAMAGAFPVEAGAGRPIGLAIPRTAEPAYGAIVEFVLTDSAGKAERWSGPYRP